MKKKLLIMSALLVLILMVNGCVKFDRKENISKISTINPIRNNELSREKVIIDPTKDLYETLNLEGLLPYKIFKMAMDGLEIINPPRRDYLAIIDFSQDSTKKRFFLIDLLHKTLVYNDFVAHGRNTGEKDAVSFSNEVNSHKSSLGFYLTNETYYGSNGYSLKLDGLDVGVNDNARERAIVVHGAPYVSENNIDENGYLGRSWGCPALPMSIYRDVIEKLKGGNIIFSYAQEYESESTILNKTDIN